MTQTRRDLTKALPVAIPALAAAMASDAQASSPKGDSADSNFFGQLQVTANVVANGRSAQTFQIDAGLYSTVAANRVRASSLGPPLRARWRAVAQDFANRFYTRGQVPDSGLLANQMQQATNEILGANVARVVMIAVIVR